MNINYQLRAGSHSLGALRAIALNYIPILSVVVLCAVSAGKAEAGEFSMRPGIIVSEEYNDNIFLATTDRVSDSVTRVMPSVIVQDKTDFWNWDVRYAYDYRYYARGTKKDDTAQSADVANRTELLKNLFIVEMKDDYSRVSLDVARDFTNESQFLNQSDRNRFTVNPYLLLKSDSRSSAALGYRYLNTWYKEPPAVNTADHIGYADVTTNLSSRTTFTMGAQFTREISAVLPFDKYDVYAGPWFTYAPGCSIYFKAGKSWLDIGKDRRSTQAFANAGITHHYSTITATFDTSLSFIPDPLRGLRREDRYTAVVRKDAERTSLSVSGSAADYRDPETKHLENTVYRISGTMKYALTTRSSIALDLAAERHWDYLASTRQDVHQSGVRLAHRATEHITLALQFRYADTTSPDAGVNDYYNNRALFEATGTF